MRHSGYDKGVHECLHGLNVGLQYKRVRDLDEIFPVLTFFQRPQSKSVHGL